jgi:DNA-directed RNA polymerase specialized sigma24 family protein
LVQALALVALYRWSVAHALPTSFREAFVLRNVRGLTYRQIAEVTSVTIDTVMSRLSCARGRIIADMRATGHDGFAAATRSVTKTFD